MQQNDSIINNTHIDNFIYAGIQFNNVSFNYPINLIPILKNISFTITKGETICIIGDTGSGKSTLLDLIMGLISPSSGYILSGNLILNHENLLKWRKCISHVPQSIFISDTTIAENIALGKNLSEIDSKESNKDEDNEIVSDEKVNKKRNISEI